MYLWSYRVSLIELTLNKINKIVSYLDAFIYQITKLIVVIQIRY